MRERFIAIGCFVRYIDQNVEQCIARNDLLLFLDNIRHKVIAKGYSVGYFQGPLDTIDTN